MADLAVVNEVVTKHLYGFGREAAAWVMLTQINLGDMTQFENIVNEILDQIDQGGRHVSLGNMMFKPEDFIAFRIE